MKNVATVMLCSLVFALTACGGGGSSGSKPKSSSSIAVSSSSVAMSSAAPSSTPVNSVVSSSAASLSSSSSSSSTAPVALTGVFVDSAVAGVKYETTPGAFTGYTSATGQYQFAEGDKVVFSIGDLKFPEVLAKGVVTPVDIAESADPANAERIQTNIAALLQSLDVDGNPDNGISIDYDTAKTTAVAVEFNQSYTDFATSPAVTALVANSGSTTTTLVGESAAKAHLDGSLAKLLVGTWYIQGDGYKYALFILDSSRYAAIDHDASVNNGAAFETGIYEWNQETGVVTLSSVEKSESGLDVEPPMANGNVLSIDGNTLTLTDGDETFELHRLVGNAEHPLNGGWSMSEEEGALVVIAFTDGHYLMGQQAEAESDGSAQSGIEIGTYNYNLETGAVAVHVDVDSNGQWGLSHSCAVLSDAEHQIYEQPNYLNCGPGGREIVQTINITGDMFLFVSEADTLANGYEEETAFERVVNGVPDGDIHLKLTVKLTLTAYEQGELFEVRNDSNQVIASMQCDRSNTPEDIEARTPGYIEQYDEAWVLGGTVERPTWVATLPANFDSATGALTLDREEPLKPIAGHPGFFDRWEDTFNATYNPDSDTVIDGTLTEVNHLSWDRNNSVSTCTSTYKVEATLR